jgi:hypothetical protein
VGWQTIQCASIGAAPKPPPSAAAGISEMFRAEENRRKLAHTDPARFLGDTDKRKKGPPCYPAERTLGSKKSEYQFEIYLGLIGNGAAGTVTVQLLT